MKKSTYAAWQQVVAAEKKLLDPVSEAEAALQGEHRHVRGRAAATGGRGARQS